MKKAIIFMLILSFLAAGVAFADAGKGKSEKQSVLLNFVFKTGFKGRTVAASPRIIALEGHKATITIGGGKSTLDDKKVDSDKELDEASREFLMKIEVTPEMVANTKPQEIKLDMKFYLKRKGTLITENFKFTVIEGKKFEFSTDDPTNNEEVGLAVTAEIYKGQFDKKKGGKVDVEVKDKKK